MSAKARPLDRIDRTILDTLQKDGRISNVELAKRVNLSPSPCIDRVRKLEQEGFIEGYGAKLSASKLGLGTTSSHHGPYDQGYTRATMVGTKGCYLARGC